MSFNRLPLNMRYKVGRIRARGRLLGINIGQSDLATDYGLLRLTSRFFRAASVGLPQLSSVVLSP